LNKGLSWTDSGNVKNSPDAFGRGVEIGRKGISSITPYIPQGKTKKSHFLHCSPLIANSQEPADPASPATAMHVASR